MNKKINYEAVYAPSENVVPRKIKDKLIIVPINDGVADFNDAMFSFNETGTRVWECIEKKQNFKAICSTLADEYAVGRDRIEQSVFKLLNTLLEKRIIKEWKN